MRNNAWIALAIVGIIIAFAVSTLTSGGTGLLDVLNNGVSIVNNTSILDFSSPLTVTDNSGTAEIDLPLADDNAFIGDSSGVPVATAWPDCDLNFQATTYSTGSNAIGCQFIPTSWQLVDPATASPWTVPGYTCSVVGFAAGIFQNDVIYGLIIPPQTLIYDSIGINVTSAGAGGTVARLGIYESNQGALGLTPGVLVVDAGTVAIDSTGVKSIVISETLEGGKPYFTAVVHDAAAVSLTSCDQNAARLVPMTSRAVTPGTSLNAGALEATGIGVGAFANPASAPDAMVGDTSGTFVKLSE